ncbi:unnamed protein product [Somion occarium]|uniref:Elongin-A n=1 Tax=Somion occarium TaxID=3059160 RepID=A0ABP1DBR9_9APHY
MTEKHHRALCDNSLHLSLFANEVLAISNVERLTSLGVDFRFDLVRPILQHCSAETLSRLEQATPHLAQDTSDLWQALCFQVYPLLAQQQYSDEAPESWRDAYFVLRDLEAERLEAAGTRLRIQREKEELRKKESQIKLTDRPPPQKRSRGWGSSQPKSLLQKTRSDAAKMHKGLYGSPLMAPMSTLKTYRPVSSATMITATPTPSSAARTSSSTPGSHVTVTAVTRPCLKPLKPPNTAAISHSPVKHTPVAKASSIHSNSHNLKSVTSAPESQRPIERRPIKPPAAKKDPMAALFLPKNRIASQLPPTSNAKPRP